jgi:hypothetical protein
VESIAKFKTELRKQKDIRQVPKHYEIGPGIEHYFCSTIFFLLEFESVPRLRVAQ